MQLHELSPGESTEIAGKIYCRCADCDKIVRMDKPIFGGLHVCITADELAEKKRRKAPQYAEKILFGCACGWYVYVNPGDPKPKKCGYCGGQLERGARCSSIPAGQAVAEERDRSAIVQAHPV